MVAVVAKATVNRAVVGSGTVEAAAVPVAPSAGYGSRAHEAVAGTAAARASVMGEQAWAARVVAVAEMVRVAAVQEALMVTAMTAVARAATRVAATAEAVTRVVRAAAVAAAPVEEWTR